MENRKKLAPPPEAHHLPNMNPNMPPQEAAILRTQGSPAVAQNIGNDKMGLESLANCELELNA
jgi:hypothetical protein